VPGKLVTCYTYYFQSKTRKINNLFYLRLRPTRFWSPVQPLSSIAPKTGACVWRVNSCFVSLSYTLQHVSPALGVTHSYTYFTLRWIDCGSLRLFVPNSCRNDERLLFLNNIYRKQNLFDPTATPSRIRWQICAYLKNSEAFPLLERLDFLNKYF
jgi:hypothetical protein